MTRNMPRITSTTQPIAFCGRFALTDFPLAGLYFAITCDGITAPLYRLGSH